MATRRSADDADVLTADGRRPFGDDDGRAEVYAALQNLVAEIDAATAMRNTLGLKVNVAVRVAKAALKRYQPPTA